MVLKGDYIPSLKMIEKIPPSAPLLILTALAAEAKTLMIDAAEPSRHEGERLSVNGTVWPPVQILQCGIGRERIINCALPHIDQAAIVGSIGVSGGLAPGLKPGTVILAESITENDSGPLSSLQSSATSVPLYELLESVFRQSGVPYRCGALFCSPKPLVSSEEKKSAYLQTGALAVDLESCGAAEAARRGSKPFFSIRVICDPAEQNLEERLLKGVDLQGNNRPLCLIPLLVRHPWLLPHLIGMARNFTRSLDSMRQAWLHVYPALAKFISEQADDRVP